MSRRTLALPPGVKLDDLEWSPLPKRKPTKKTRELEQWIEKNKRRNDRSRRRRLRKKEDKQIARRCKQLALVVAADLLQIRAEENEQAIAKFREQQAREAKAYAEKLAKAFHAAVIAEAKKA